jgi:hypothetical protein
MLLACFDYVRLVVYFAGCQSVNHTFLMGFSVCMCRLVCMFDSLRMKCWEIWSGTWPHHYSICHILPFMQFNVWCNTVYLCHYIIFPWFGLLVSSTGRWAHTMPRCQAQSVNILRKQSRTANKLKFSNLDIYQKKTMTCYALWDRVG